MAPVAGILLLTGRTRGATGAAYVWLATVGRTEDELDRRARTFAGWHAGPDSGNRIEIALARYEQIITLEAEVADMVERFETRKLVDRAKGLLNEKMGLTEPEAFRWIQKASMDRRLTMHDVSQAIIEQLSAKK